MKEKILNETHLADAVDITADSARYDTAAKELLADKQILAMILKYSLAEFEDMNVQEIVECLDEPVVSQINVNPGQTNTSKVKKSSEEDSVIGEGKLLYDIRFSAYLKVMNEDKVVTKIIKFLMNVEAQKSTKKNELGYEIDNRIIFYMSRMVSSQKEVEFVNSNYDDIKPVRSIWICMDGDTDKDSINRLRLKQENVYGKELPFNNLDKFVGVVITLRKNDNVEESKNILIAMLEDLLRQESAKVKKQKLSRYGLKMTESMERKVNTMCNLSEVLIEKGYDRGVSHGYEQGERNIILKMLANGKNLEEIADLTGIELEKVERWCQTS